jgi:heptosyltransferase-2
VTKILIIAPAWVGDTVMAQPLFMGLKQRFPDALIDVYAPHWVAPVLARMPEVNAVILNPFGHGQLRLFERLRAARKLRTARYDQAIVLPNSFKSALIPFFAGIPQRTGFVGEMRYGLLNDARPLDEQIYPLLVERFALLAEPRQQALARPVPTPRLRINDNQRDATLLRLHLSSQQPIVALCPGAEYGPAKRWPAEHFGQLAQSLHKRGFQIWLIGSAKDQAIGAAVNAASGAVCRNLCGETTLDEAIDLLSCATSVVSNDSGLMHVAAALNKPLLALYGSSSPDFTPPLSEQARIISLNLACSPCFKRECPLGHFDCMLKLTPDRVLKVLPTLSSEQERNII